jgi:hypothetical protein
MRHSDPDMCRRRIAVIQAVEGHPNVDEVHSAVHLRQEILGVRAHGVSDPGHGVLSYLVEL